MEWTVFKEIMGMLATVINGILQGALEDKGMLTVYKLF
jgi:uridylate kinase